MTFLNVIPVETGNQIKLDSRLRGNDRGLSFLDIRYSRFDIFLIVLSCLYVLPLEIADAEHTLTKHEKPMIISLNQVGSLGHVRPASYF